MVVAILLLCMPISGRGSDVGVMVVAIAAIVAVIAV